MHLSASEGILVVPTDDTVAISLAESHASHAWEKTGGKYLLLAGDFYWTESAVQFVFDYLE